MFEETPSQAWKKRFGVAPDSELPDLERFLNHRSVREYSDQEVPESVVAALIACAQSASTSSNLHLWTAISVQDPDRRRELALLCGDQKQVHNAPWFFGFFADHYRIRQAALAAGATPATLDYNEFFTMAVIDAALAAERMVCAAEALGLGVCYIGALRNDAFGVQKLLDLPMGVFGVFGLCIGYPAEDSTADIKPRPLSSSVWHKETYGHAVDMSEYDARMSEFYESQGMKGDVTWSMRSGRRLGESQLSGRDRLKEYLGQQDMDVR